MAVGPRVFLSAAHTLLEKRFRPLLRRRPDEPITLHLELHGEVRRASVWAHPAYIARHAHPSADLLIGAFFDGPEAFAPADVRTVDVRRRWFRPEPDVWVSGWGNVQPEGPADGRFSAGCAKVAGPHPGYAVELEGGAMLGPGDSGGGVFSAPGSAGRLVGIAIAIAPNGDPSRSVVATLASPRTREWLEQWMRREGLAIAGIAPPVEAERPASACRAPARAAC